MSATTTSQAPPQESYLNARTSFLSLEQAHAASRQDLAQALKSLPSIPLTKSYTFTSASSSSPVPLSSLFGSHSQLIVYHYMFPPPSTSKSSEYSPWPSTDGCHGCAFTVTNFPDARHLAQKDTALVAVSRAPIEAIEAWKERNGWISSVADEEQAKNQDENGTATAAAGTPNPRLGKKVVNWVSCGDGDFNYDFGGTISSSRPPLPFTVLPQSTPSKGPPPGQEGDRPGFSIFERAADGKVSYVYGKFEGVDSVSGIYGLLDLVRQGRSEGRMGPAEFWTGEELLVH